jgi:uncharacterized protein (DUF4415 family)
MRKAARTGAVRTGAASTGIRRAGKDLTAKQKGELSALAAKADDQIDTSDIPVLPPAAWRMPDAVRGRFYRPVKRAVSMRLDADVVAWLKKAGKGYQTRANRILRERMLDELRRARGGGSTNPRA